MKVESGKSVGGAGAVKGGAKGKGGGDFAGNLTVDAKAPVAPVQASAPLSGIEGLFALQEVPDATADRKRALARGDQMLDRLDDLRRGLLLGQVGRDKLTDLARLAREGSERVSDSRIRDVLQEIELRAQVELAKLQQRG